MPRQERERRFIAEYVLEAFPSGDWMLNVPLGEVPAELVRIRGTAAAAAIFRPQRRRVDAVSWSPHAYYIVEAKIRDPFEGIGRLVTYAKEALRTNDLPGYEGQPIIPRLVVPFVIERDRISATELDIEIVEFSPVWIGEYVRERQLYFTAEHRLARQERNDARRLFGLE